MTARSLPGLHEAATPARRAARTGPVFAGLTAVAAGVGVLAGYPVSLWALTALGFGAAVLGIWRSPLGLLGISLLCTIDAPTRIFLMRGGLLRWNTLNYWLILVGILALPRVLRLGSAQVRLLTLFLVLLLLWTVPSPDPSLGVQHLLNIACTYGLVGYAVAGGADRATWRWVAWACGLAGAVGGMAYYLNAASLPYANPNAWTMLPLTAILALVVGQLAGATGREQLAFGLLAAVNLVWIFLSGSRGSLLTSLAALGVMLVAIPGMGRRATLATAAAMILLAISVQFGNLQAVALHRVSKLWSANATASERTSGRADLVLGGWYIFLDHPGGVGTGGFASAWAELGPREGLSTFERGEEFPAHAGWIKTLAENGIPGIVLQLLLVASFAWTGIRSRHRSLRLLGLLTALVLGLGWITTEFQSKGLWWLCAASAVLLASRAPAHPHAAQPLDR